jgi:hypothetical protein
MSQLGGLGKLEAKKVPPFAVAVVIGLVGVIFLVMGLVWSVKTAKVVFIWEKGQGEVGQIEEGVSRSRRGGERPSYRPTFVVKQADGTTKSYRNTVTYSSTEGIEVGTVCTIRYSKEGEAILDEVWSIYSTTGFMLGFGVLMLVIAWSAHGSRAKVIEENRANGFG